MSDRLSFDDDLRRVLASRAAQAPLPPETLRVPPGWVRAHRSVTEVAGRSLAFVLVAAAAGVLSVQLSVWLQPVTQERTLSSVAGMVAVPEQQVLATQDGFLAVRFSPSQPETVELLLIVPDGEPRLLATGWLEPDARASGILSMATFPISCETSRGLAQPNIVFGYVQLAAAPVDQITIDVPSTGTSNDGLFLFALDPAIPPTAGVLRAGSSEHPEFGGASQITPDRLSNADRCRGESVEAAE